MHSALTKVLLICEKSYGKINAAEWDWSWRASCILCSLEMQLPIIFTNVMGRGEDIGITKYSSSLGNVKKSNFLIRSWALCSQFVCLTFTSDKRAENCPAQEIITAVMGWSYCCAHIHCSLSHTHSSSPQKTLDFDLIPSTRELVTFFPAVLTHCRGQDTEHRDCAPHKHHLHLQRSETLTHNVDTHHAGVMSVLPKNNSVHSDSLGTERLQFHHGI